MYWYIDCFETNLFVSYSSTMYNNECTCIYKNKITIHCKHFVTLIHVLFS